VAAEVIAGHDAAFPPMTIPSVAYTSPEVAWMGMTEKEAKAQKIAYNKGKFLWGASGRALSAGASSGVTKVLFDKESGRIIGAGICGLNAGELIHEAVLALEMGANAEDISKTVHAHPTLAETFAFGAEIVDGSITDVLPPKKR
jgi:dihydrolipoamide dehydrogenase